MPSAAKIELSDTYGSLFLYLLPFVKPAVVRHVLEREQAKDLPESYHEAVKAAIDRMEADPAERNILVAVIHELAETKTVILISHRLANVVKADQIYMLKNGVITEQGKHCELLEAGKEYAALYQYQIGMEQYAEYEQTTDRKAVAV